MPEPLDPTRLSALRARAEATLQDPDLDGISRREGARDVLDLLAALEADAARWQFAPEGMEGESPGWWLGAGGKGSRPVWVLWLE